MTRKQQRLTDSVMRKALAEYFIAINRHVSRRRSRTSCHPWFMSAAVTARRYSVVLLPTHQWFRIVAQASCIASRTLVTVGAAIVSRHRSVHSDPSKHAAQRLTITEANLNQFV